MISRLHLVTDDRILGGPGFAARASDALTAGEGRVTFHLRGPATPGRRLWELGTHLRPRARTLGAPFLVNGRLDVALALEADGAQLGAASFSTPEARSLLGSDALLGRSVHSGGEARDAAETADFVLAGALYATPSHPERPAGGVGLIEEVRAALTEASVVGIGGITVDRVQDVLAAGAHGVAVIRAVWDAPNPARAVVALLDALESAAGAEA